MFHSNVVALSVNDPEIEDLARQLGASSDPNDQLMLLAVVCQMVADEGDDHVMVKMASKFRRAVEKRHEELQDEEVEDTW